MTDTEYIREQDRQEYRNFCMHHIPNFARPLLPEMWHYTNADGLINILKSGQVWSTQVSCLNDNLEQKYFGSLVHAAVKIQRAERRSKPCSHASHCRRSIGQRGFPTDGHFVACFSEVEDDLGQWRG